MGRWIYLNLVLRWLYRPTQRFLHRFDLHYMRPSYPERDKVLWCRWCGARYRVPKGAKALDAEKREA